MCHALASESHSVGNTVRNARPGQRQFHKLTDAREELALCRRSLIRSNVVDLAARMWVGGGAHDGVGKIGNINETEAVVAVPDPFEPASAKRGDDTGECGRIPRAVHPCRADDSRGDKVRLLGLTNEFLGLDLGARVVVPAMDVTVRICLSKWRTATGWGKAIHADRTDLDEVGHLGLLRRFQNVPRALDGGLHEIAPKPVDVYLRGGMNDHVSAPHDIAESGGVFQCADNQLDAERLEEVSAGRGADNAHYMVAALDKSFRNVTTKKTRSPCEKDAHE